ncbi:MAG: MarR family transcriptional regulator [Pseudomonadota bacterium]
MDLTPAMRDFILHWGEMGARWGVNRSVAQVHALIHLSRRPLPAEEIAETLGIARSNVSTAIRELQGWKLVKVSRELGDRRDHFTGVQDLFELVRAIIEGRREREFLPTLEVLRQVNEQADDDGDTPADVSARMRETLELMELFDAWYQDVARLPRGTQMAMLRAGGALARVLPKAIGKGSERAG